VTEYYRFAGIVLPVQHYIYLSSSTLIFLARGLWEDMYSCNLQLYFYEVRLQIDRCPRSSIPFLKISTQNSSTVANGQQCKMQTETEHCKKDTLNIKRVAQHVTRLHRYSGIDCGTGQAFFVYTFLCQQGVTKRCRLSLLTK